MVSPPALAPELPVYVFRLRYGGAQNSAPEHAYRKSVQLNLSAA